MPRRRRRGGRWHQGNTRGSPSTLCARRPSGGRSDAGWPCWRLIKSGTARCCGRSATPAQASAVDGSAATLRCPRRRRCCGSCRGRLRRGRRKTASPLWRGKGRRKWKPLLEVTLLCKLPTRHPSATERSEFDVSARLRRRLRLWMGVMAVTVAPISMTGPASAGRVQAAAAALAPLTTAPAAPAALTALLRLLRLWLTPTPLCKTTSTNNSQVYSYVPEQVTVPKTFAG